MEKVTDIVTEKQINIAWGNADFGNDRNAIDKYKLIANGVLKCASGFCTGDTMQCILEELGLVLQTWELSPRGKRYLFAAYNTGLSV
jgi:hypothetical protein